MLDRRSVIGSGLTLAALGGVAAAPNTATASTKQSGAMTLDECVDSCLASHRMCLETARYCTEQGGTHIAAAHIALLLDCAELCQTTANSMLRRSPQHALLCDACARMCDACARDCAKFAGDARMQACAQTCRDCAASCRDMAAMGM